MFRTIYRSTVSYFDLMDALKGKKINLGFAALLMDYPIHFFF